MGGALDLLLGQNTNTPDRLPLNDGTGVFVSVASSKVPGISGIAATFVDVDGDGDLDVVSTNNPANGGQNHLCLNDGTGIFIDVTQTRLPPNGAYASDGDFGDIDGDGDLDLVTANYALYRNDGTGVFADVTATHMPLLSGYPSSTAAAWRSCPRARRRSSTRSTRAYSSRSSRRR